MKKLIGALIVVCGLLLAQTTGIQTLLLNTPTPPGVQNVYVTPSGTAGQTNYCYWVVAVFAGGMSFPTGPTCNAASNGTLSGSNYNTVSWNLVNGATGYWVIRSTNSVFPATGTTAVNNSVLSSTTASQTDQSNSLNSFTYTPIGTAIGQISLNNRDYSTPTLLLLDQYGIPQQGWSQTASAANFLRNKSAVASSDPSIIANGSDTNIDIELTPKGTGGVTVNGNTVFARTGSVPNATYVVTGSLTVAEINTGTTVVAAVTNRTLRVVDFEVQAIGGAFSGCTLVQIVDTTGTPVVSVGIPIAVLTQNTIVGPGASGVVFTTYSWQGALTASQGLKINQTGSACATATSLNYRISYTIS